MKSSKNKLVETVEKIFQKIQMNLITIYIKNLILNP